MRHMVARILRNARGTAPAAAIVTNLLCTPAMGAPGDLDPAFGETGRLEFDVAGPAWALQPVEPDEFIVGGGNYTQCGWYCYYYQDVNVFANGYIARYSAAGVADPDFVADGIAGVQVLDVALQPDGRVVGVGRDIEENVPRLAVFRLESDGSPDPGFGEGGIVRYSPDAEPHVASAVVLEPDGRIVVAGMGGARLKVLKFQPDGQLDATFGEAGVVAVPGFRAADPAVRLVRTTTGAYRVTTSLDGSSCAVLGLTPAGEPDPGFGTDGFAVVALPSSAEPASCGPMLLQPDERLVVAGSVAGAGYAARLMPDGAIDPGFATDALAAKMQYATALGLAADGAIVVAGRGADDVAGAVVARLQSGGGLDESFGEQGSTWIDLQSTTATAPVVNDVTVLDDGKVLLAGGDLLRRMPFVARLTGEDDPDGPGIIGIVRPLLQVREGDTQAVVTVRRMGGSSGAVSVDYGTSVTGSGLYDAAAGVDFVAATGQLTWADGETGEQQIVVSLGADGPATEEIEQFAVGLGAVQGGAGFGTRKADVWIAADGEPGGLFSISAPLEPVVENAGTVEVSVHRGYYWTGAVSVTVTAVPDSAAAGDDFGATPVTLTWADGDSGSRLVQFVINNDDEREDQERFTVQLSAPGGGAAVGPQSSAEILIAASDQPAPPPPSNSGGGGAAGLWSMFLLAAAALRRRLRASAG